MEEEIKKMEKLFKTIIDSIPSKMLHEESAKIILRKIEKKEKLEKLDYKIIKILLEEFVRKLNE